MKRSKICEFANIIKFEKFVIFEEGRYRLSEKKH